MPKRYAVGELELLHVAWVDGLELRQDWRIMMMMMTMMIMMMSVCLFVCVVAVSCPRGQWEGRAPAGPHTRLTQAMDWRVATGGAEAMRQAVAAQRPVANCGMGGSVS